MYWWCQMSFLLFIFWIGITASQTHESFQIEEASVAEIQAALHSRQVTSRQLVQFYTTRISHLNPTLHAVIELNPDAFHLADEADRRRSLPGHSPSSNLEGIPVLLKDCIATADKLNTTAGSLALLGSKVPRDAGIVSRLRRAGAIILGKLNLSEWMNFRSTNSSDGWSARGGQTKNPYNPSVTPCGSSSGSGVAAAANLASVTIGTETDASIICPSSYNAVVGIKPTVGLTSRAGVIPISHTQDTPGPVCRTVADAVELLQVMVGPDDRDAGSISAQVYIPSGGYRQFLKLDGLRGKRLGVLQTPFFEQVSQHEVKVIKKFLSLARKMGAAVVENLTLENTNDILLSGNEILVLLVNFKLELNRYLEELVESPVRSLREVISFNKRHAAQELSLFGQELLLESEKTTGRNATYRKALKRMKFLTKHGLDKLLRSLKLDALVAPTSSSISVPPAIAGYPVITIPAGYDRLSGAPFGISFVGTRGSEPTLIEIAFALEQATLARKPPTIKVPG